MSENETEASAAWSNIEAGHGLITVDLAQAAMLDIPETVTHPKDPTKKVYVIQAYHEIHCIVSFSKITLFISRLRKP